ncbi:MAG: bifunctional methylenetetrahydrofolate dehydrogenase/methenyltetrahydrofolate cyclohydrolase FolD [Nitrospira sp.]|nr:bifunctional methylenetetrahydrofolate dehydrogenase/methenyltetrahydrofolate cyclohydrolase FolD [Nitrospira sp.]MCA9475158.1 bifunctional methylenetetrahydrofolate dehydrogenase/methenyltetrahydrofolate cyclohydrolase FolD [Nitrospira sp.]MCA9479491.1 bifunctional methylenetetrahydrofolate dehydrogenase/methenyltetrahydrofolate cyclohydrolase FolD [Nitrospira sp.]MCB9710011.1 bifunctional methylenetetrahydrofolate dehydrogenase/methenyltetrahydrofolate cyclohydrolase FolD [Nitrospiraceae ba
MSALIIDGKALALTLREAIAQGVQELVKTAGIKPGLAAVLVGDDPASAVYVRNKKLACEKAGIFPQEHRLPASTTQESLVTLIHQLNGDERIHGILVQLPLPSHIDTKIILQAVSPDKDADGFHPVNVGHLVEGDPIFVPCTPKGVMHMIDSTGEPIAGKRAVVIGRSNIVGKPVAMLLLHRHATVTICHSRTQDLPGVVREADIVVAAIGKPHFVTKDMVKPGAMVIDVGINRLPDGQLVGDVDFDRVKEQAGWITPVPGGVGPMTIAMLLQNTLESARRKAGC